MKAFSEQGCPLFGGDIVSGERRDTWPATIPFVLANWRIIIEYEQQSKADHGQMGV